MGLVPDDQIWIVTLGFVVSFILAFALGANDVANSFATSVGSKVLTLRQACILGTIFEVLGAVLLGARVSDTIRKGIIDVQQYEDKPELLMVGMLSALFGGCIWLLIATVLKLPVSGTHSIVGSTVGFALVAHGLDGISWLTLAKITGSWIAAPLLSGIVSTLLFLLVRRFIIDQTDSLTAGLRFLPGFYGATVLVNAVPIFFDGPEQFGFDKIPLYGSFILAFGLAIITTVSVQLFLVPRQRSTIEAELKQMELRGNASDDTDKFNSKSADLNHSSCPGVYKMVDEVQNGGTDVVETQFNNDKLSGQANAPSTFTSASLDNSDIEEDEDPKVQDKPEVAGIFSRLQILTAIFGSFAHGGNDVSNAIAPFIAIWLIATLGNVEQKAATPLWALAFGGAGIAIGLWALGRRVIETMGKDLTKITPSSGFTIEIGSALTVLIGTYATLPLSTTHCKVGSVICVGRLRSQENVDWKIFRNILIAWFVTLPAACGLSAATFYGLQFLVPPLGPPWATSEQLLNSTISNTTSLATADLVMY